MAQEKLRNLDSYKSQQAKVAEAKGVAKELAAARTLTEARRIVYGEKKKTYSSNRTKGSNK